MPNRDRATRSPRRAAPEGGGADSIPTWEWVVAIAGALLVAASLAYLVHRALAGDDAPPEFAVAVESVSPCEGGHRVLFRVHNHGGRPAAAVLVEGELRAGDDVERAEATLDYVPPGSATDGGMFFAGDPRRGELVLRARSFQTP
jgi:uncharacterized protein (TIGR02588 family)